MIHTSESLAVLLAAWKVSKKDKLNLSEIGSYRKKAIQILDEVNYDQ